jgi:tRNA-splicing ligase RtcB (3'-phosphate/5'-hydroxy nucleic acid ligase)
MNKKQLLKLGVPEDCVSAAIEAVSNAGQRSDIKSKDAMRAVPNVVKNPTAYTDDAVFGAFARALIAEQQFAPKEPIAYRTWGAEGIEEQSHVQMRTACSLPNAVGAALMPDAHVGYGLPIGGVLALENAVCPYAVGVDIACRMKLSVLDLPADTLDSEPMYHVLRKALESGTRFGAGVTWNPRQQHDVLDQDWTVTRVTREMKDKAANQLGTSGSGNHFVEFGLLTLDKAELGLEAGTYVALLSHSGSRGPGHAVCSQYSSLAQSKLPRRYEELRNLAWLDLDTEAGQEYWAAMNLMGDYAAANHDVIHRNVSRLAGAQVIAGVENHHNFAWKETHGGREVVVHRKGATPAGPGVLGVIPGSMATPAFVVRGLGNDESLWSASHGAGRLMSRKKARDSYRFRAVQNDLATKGVRVLSAGADEVPYVYKDIHQVMAAQTDLVETIARFDPRIVKMCEDGSPPED